MANTFYRKTLANIGLIANTVGSYTVGGGVTSVVLSLSIANTSGSTVYASAFVANGASLTYIVKSAPVSAGGTLVVIGGDQKVVLQTNDNVKVVSDTVNSLDCIMSVMEIT
jgi:hypothetical protein